ncbi:FAD:protein FMN transferase [Dyella tabacisoli]|uniref:FAD:protein FMN transferase n=1 Tax=Dyella tabacisoli TaxID=2282381 RepID=UPI0013B40B42|nr:FAD:protein FMN transferase [Dyella tabacisoli]
MPINTIERARPLLGTTVTIRVQAADAALAHDAISAAFADIARVHTLMSFHEPDSDLTRLHSAPVGARVIVDAQTAHVLRAALALSALSDGVFDVTVAAQLVAWDLLPPPPGAIWPTPGAGWRDIHIDDDNGVRLGQPLWVDLGGIAKGYAVDCAIDRLRAHGIEHACVNAGGDLRTLGEGPHIIAIDTGETAPSHRPLLELGEAAVATSSGRAHVTDDHRASPHVHGLTRSSIGRHDCVTVVAPQCMHADALTKLVMARGAASVDLLEHFGAAAYCQDAHGNWSALGQSSLGAAA